MAFAALQASLLVVLQPSLRSSLPPRNFRNEMITEEKSTVELPNTDLAAVELTEV